MGPLHVYGHSSAQPELVANCFGGIYTHEVHSESSAAIFAINPSAGIDQTTIDLWAALDQYQIPRLVVVTDLEKLEADFDDAVMIANRVFAQMATPYLVLHDEAGLPTALICLDDLTITDYSATPSTVIESEPEHHTLVQEFQSEYIELRDSSGDEAFAAGLLFPAIPLWIEKGMGVDVVHQYLKQLTH